MLLKRKKLWLGIFGILILLATLFFVFWFQDNKFRIETLVGEGECVFVVHGLGRSAGAMRKIVTFLNKNNFETINLNYPSRKFGVADLTEKFLKPTILENCRDGKRINFVTHSLGGILVRKFLAENDLPNLGRVVSFAPPNHGSEISDFLGKFWVFRFIFGPALVELGTGENDIPRNLGPPNFELGIIAGNKSWNPIFSKIIPGPDDDKVSVESAKLENMTDFIEVRNSHTFIMNAAKNQELAKKFLETGAFE